MKSMQRKFGGLLKRSDDVADVGAVLAEFKSVDDMLDRLIIDLKAWRDGWEDILKLQYDAAEAFTKLYQAIEPTADPEMTRTPTVTPQRYVQKCTALQNLYADVRADLVKEVALISTQLLRPVEDAKVSTKALHKTLKHRENMKRDYERYLSRVEHSRKKDNRSVKEEAALAKHESDLTQSQIDYNTADEQVKQTFPPVTAAVVSLLPLLLARQVMLQTTLVGQLYTVLSAYNKRNGLPGPEVTDNEIIAAWDREFTGFRKELEGGISTIANGKAVRLAMTLPPEKDKSTLTGLGIRKKVMNLKTSAGPNIPPKVPSMGATDRHNSHHQIENLAYDEEEQAPPKPPRPAAPSSPMHSSYGSPMVPTSSKPRIPSVAHSPVPGAYDQHPASLTPNFPQSPPSYDQVGSSPPSRYQTPSNGAPSPMGLLSAVNNGGGNNDYFLGAARRTSNASTIASTYSSGVASAAAKKKPPPPIPVKRIPSATVPYVTALYDFEGQNPGDLVFREGDRIRVVTRTESTDDWWEGELRGKIGVFPANYVKA
ncbi:Hypothetical protein R9X50_00592900 [Acrodontium crateriforme]|uniref:SH3 domain-containing protein n=1 Tax=Acrodontium crateriforme TaxID=150365 RepID=A0AAQ3M850_9PEZI|nr:Hypothetical protein R9X50_00592900 [Acrodontium crateriforme]